MNVAFLTPPTAQREGGLDAAIGGLRQALEQEGIAVTDGLGPDISVAHFHGLWQRPFIHAAKRCREAGIPYLISPHGMLEPWAWRHKRWKKWPYFHLIEKHFLTSASVVLATAESEARRLQAILPRQRIETHPLGLTGHAMPDYASARTKLGWKPEERVLLYLSRLHVKKGLDLLLQALTTMGVSPDVRLVIVGDGPGDYVRKVHRFAQRHAASLPPITWEGAIWGEARWPFLQGADLFCLPTHSENFGLAVLEACQVGTPALTTTETPWAQHLADGRGYICQPSVESIRHSLTRFMAQPPLDSKSRTALADWAQTTFSWDVLSKQYIKLYSSLASADAP